MSPDWDAAYREHYPLMLRYLARRGADRLLAEDLAQEVFVRAMKSSRTFTDDGRGLGPWLCTIAKNILIDHGRRGSTRYEVVSVDVDVWEVFCAAVPAAEDVVMANDDIVRLRAAVDRLSPDQRQAMLLHYWGGWPLVRVGRRMYRSEGAVKTLLFRSRKHLGELLEAA